MPYELSHEDIVMCGEKLTVYQASNQMDMERSYLIAEANSQPITEGPRSEYLRYMTTLLYPSLVACTTGVIPTLEEFIYKLPNEETKKWIDTASRLNPSWFTFLVQDGEASVEKKEQSLTDSSSV